LIGEEKTTFTTDTPPYALRKPIATIKDAVPIEQIATEYGEFKLLGNGRLLGRCVAQDHTDRTPSMTIFTDTQRFKCFGCGIAGDVIDFEEVAGRHLETWTAIVALSTRYKIELPQRPGRWHSWQDEKARIQEAAKQRVAVTYQRRLTRVYAPLVLVGGETPGEEIEALEGLASALWPISLSLAERRVAGEE
jgi:DNA primase